MSEMVRVVLLPTDGDAASDRQIVLDLLIDDTGSAVGPFPAFGRMGDFRKPEKLYPFALMGDGRLDYGAHAEDGARQDKLAIRGMQLAPGTDVTGTAAYMIESVTPLVTP